MTGGGERVHAINSFHKNIHTYHTPQIYKNRERMIKKDHNKINNYCFNTQQQTYKHYPQKWDEAYKEKPQK